jgi:hypothetical protein
LLNRAEYSRDVTFVVSVGGVDLADRDAHL